MKWFSNFTLALSVSALCISLIGLAISIARVIA